MDFVQTIWLPLGVTVIAYLYMMHEYRFSPIEPEANPKFIYPMLGLLLTWGAYTLLWIIVLIAEKALLPFVSWLSCSCSIF